MEHHARVTALRRALGQGASEQDRLHGALVGKAGWTGVSRWRSGELQAYTGIPEDRLHELIEDGIRELRYGSESHPCAVILLDQLPDYEPPPLGPVPSPPHPIVLRLRGGRYIPVYEPLEDDR